MILQSTQVQKLIDEYKKRVPEVPLGYAETKYGIIVYVPKNFNTFPLSVRLLAKAEMEAMFTTFRELGVPFTVKPSE